MSAAQPYARPYTPESLKEAEALYQIGHRAAVARSRESTLESIVALGLRVPGVTGIALEPRPDCGWPCRRFDTVSTLAPQGTAVAEIAAAGRVWGTIRMSFSLCEIELESPLRFARFIGQQIGIALNRIELLKKHQATAALSA